MTEPDYKMPAIAGGLMAGLLSVAPYLNFACCLWAPLGGVVAARMLIKRSATPLTSRDGAWIGLLAGIIAGGLFFIILAPITLWQMPTVLQTLATDTRIPPDIQTFYIRLSNNSGLRNLLAVGGVFIGSIILMGLTVLGGVIGVSIFEKRKESPMPGTTSDTFD